MSNISSFLRLRPSIDKSSNSLWDLLSPTVLYSLSENKHHMFTAIHGPKSSTHKLFNESVLPLLQESVNNADLAVVLTGPKTSGKSFTVYGTKVYPGLISYTIDYIFEYVSSNSGEYLISFSFLEVYKDNFFDLLSGECFEDASDSKIRRQICVSPKQLKHFIAAGTERQHEDCHSIFTIILEALQDQLKITHIRFFDLVAINTTTSEEVIPTQKIRPFRQILLLKSPKNRFEKSLYYLLCTKIAVITTLAMDQTGSEIFSTLKFLDRLRTVTWDKNPNQSTSTLSKLKRKLEKLKDKIRANPEDDSLEAEYQIVKSKIIFTDSSQSLSIEPSYEVGIKDVKEVKVLQHHTPVKENFNFEIMDDPCLPLPHEQWIKLIVEQDIQLTHLRHSIKTVDLENLELERSLKSLKGELEDLKRNAFNYL